ncbi:hypothetical protein [Bradyrhizobium sp.]|uniref:hypothetical protein n=1 Tax=Bradyrhizobium sp. TaxID=376 RepID=UPI003BB1AB4E
MPALTRRRSRDHRQECWLIYFGDIHAGTITERVGNPHDAAQWEWRCGFYPGSHPGDHQSGTAASFDEARADFESAWKIFLSKRIEGRFSGMARSAGLDRRENMRCGMRAKSWNTCADDLASRTAKGASWLDQRSDLGICR